MAAPRKYPDELRERASREVRSTGRPIAHVAKDLGIHTRGPSFSHDVRDSRTAQVHQQVPDTKRL